MYAYIYPVTPNTDQRLFGFMILQWQVPPSTYVAPPTARPGGSYFVQPPLRPVQPPLQNYYLPPPLSGAPGFAPGFAGPTSIPYNAGGQFAPPPAQAYGAPFGPPKTSYYQTQAPPAVGGQSDLYAQPPSAGYYQPPQPASADQYQPPQQPAAAPPSSTSFMSRPGDVEQSGYATCF